MLAADTAEHWIREKVDFTAAYADERVSADVYLPLGSEPPYQTVTYFPGSRLQAALVREPDRGGDGRVHPEERPRPRLSYL